MYRWHYNPSMPTPGDFDEDMCNHCEQSFFDECDAADGSQSVPGPDVDGGGGVLAIGVSRYDGLSGLLVPMDAAEIRDDSCDLRAGEPDTDYPGDL
jgi:hypothetical protein